MNRYIFDHEGKTFVCFGWGGVQVGVSADSGDQAMIWLSDVCRENPVGAESGQWEAAAGQQVVLGFNSLESLAVLQEAINKAKYILEKK